MQAKEKVLAVDDSEFNLEIIKEALGDEYNLKTATIGEEALEIVLDYQPNIVLLDIMMPGTDGYEVCRQMRADPALRDIKIIMLSAKAMTSERLKGYDAGADDYIIKPFDADELLAKVRVYSRLSTLEEVECLNKKLQSAILELTNTNEELREFAHIAAHDLKTPLRGIGILANWILTDYADKFDEEGKKQVRMLVTKAEQMSVLIDSILQYSKLGRKTIVKQQVDLSTVLSEVISTIDLPENIEITVENELPALMCDKTHIIRIFQNLLSNAVKYMDKPEGQIKVGCIEQDGCWIFSVADDGPGIDEKYFKKIFQIFQTLTPREGVDSTGIGLSIVRKITDLNGGKVWIESEVGKGSTFFFTFPKQETEIADSRKLEANSACRR